MWSLSLKNHSGRGERIRERNLEVLYKAESMEVTIGLRGWLDLWCLMDPLIAGGIASLIKKTLS